MARMILTNGPSVLGTCLPVLGSGSLVGALLGAPRIMLAVDRTRFAARYDGGFPAASQRAATSSGNDFRKAMMKDSEASPETGGFVAWSAYGTTQRGRINTVYKSGVIKPNQNHPGFLATAKAPVLEVELFKEDDGGFKPTGEMVLRPSSLCSVVSDLRKPVAFTGIRNIAGQKDQPDEILIYSDIAPDGWGGVSAKNLYDALQKTTKGKAINLRMNSPGGDAFEGMAMKNLLVQHRRASGSTITAYNDSLIASAATIVACGCDQVFASRPSLYMVHRAWSIAVGNVNDFQKTIDLLTKVDEQSIDLYTAKTGKDRKDITDLVDAESWMDVDESLKWGFVDKIIEDGGSAKASLGAMRPWMKHLPEGVKDKFTKSDGKMLSRVPALPDRAEAIQPETL